MKKHSPFFILVTLVMGAITGVGIWFTITLVHPAATSSLINTFVWGWAMEWTFFIVEILAAILYWYGWKRMNPRDHLVIGWVFKDKLAALCPNQHAIFDSDVKLNTYGHVPGLDEIDWDLVVWPGNGSKVPEYLDSVGAVTIPDAWKVRRDKWFYIHSDVLKE